MYAVRCPGCGRPAPLSVASPDQFQCPACGHVGPPPPAVVEQLQRAAGVLSRQDVRRRQLSTVQRRMIASGLFGTVGYVAALLLVISPFACCFGLWIVTQTDRPMDWAAGFMWGMPVALLAVFGGSGLLFLRSRLAKVRARLAAFPPSAPGEPAGCHVCGGPIPPRATAAFVRCPYCAADNLVDPRVLAKLGDRREQILDGFESEVANRAEIARQALRSALRGLALGALVTVPVTCVLTGALLFVIWEIETDPYDELEYALVDSPDGRCVAEAKPYVGRPDWTRLDPGGWGGADRLTEARPRSMVPTLEVRDLVGLRVRSVDNTEHRDWIVVRATGTGGTAQNRLDLRADDGLVRRDWVTEICLIEGATSPIEPVPLVVEVPEPSP